MAQQLENIKTAIRVYPGMQILEAAEIVGMLMSHFSARSEAGAILLDCVQSLEMAHDAEETYNEPAGQA